MLQDFLDGNLWLLIDKDRKEEVSDLCKIVQDCVKTWSFQMLEYSLFEYLCCKSSGPYHYMIGDMLTGNKRPKNKPVMRLTDFLNDLDEPDIQEDEIMEMLK